MLNAEEVVRVRSDTHGLHLPRDLEICGELMRWQMRQLMAMADVYYSSVKRRSRQSFISFTISEDSLGIDFKSALPKHFHQNGIHDHCPPQRSVVFDFPIPSHSLPSCRKLKLPKAKLSKTANSTEKIPKLKAKLLEASSIYSQDKETLSWFVMQSVHDPRDFTIIERYENEDSQQYHLANPYWKTFDPAVLPMLEEVQGGNVNGGKMDLRRFEELVEGQ